MGFSLRSKLPYGPLEKSDPNEEGYSHEEHARYIQAPNRMHNARVALLSCVSTVAVCVVTLGLFNRAASTKPVAVCAQPSLRQEWRTLSDPEKDSYIEAVQCLSTKPSMSVTNDTLYDDFPRVHELTSPTAHKSAPFLPWHRYYIHSYETALKESCGYSGSLPYWDWSQDWNEFENSPIWSSEKGFGGNGNGDVTIGEGSCVLDGPFSGLEARYYADELRPHCLSRGFSEGEELKELAELISPNAMANILREKKFESFAPKLEARAHRFISGSIKGDFSKYTGPYGKQSLNSEH